jgi:hydroxymethylpyrimidine pyrophosphatase-like HAD family hydrolase
MSGRPTFFDIDGTLTSTPTKMWGPVIPERISEVRDLLNRGYPVVLWSGNGTNYAHHFAQAHGLEDAYCIGKPEAIIDDNPDIRPRHRMKVYQPDEWFQG